MKPLLQPCHASMHDLNYIDTAKNMINIFLRNTSCEKVWLKRINCFQELLTATSNQFWQFSDGLKSFGEVNILIPPSWDIISCLGMDHDYISLNWNLLFLGGRDVAQGHVFHADIHVSESQHYLGDIPWSLQHLGCRQQVSNIMYSSTRKNNLNWTLNTQ